MKLLASVAPHIKFTWIAAGLLGALAASLALRRRSLPLPSFQKNSPATSRRTGISVRPSATEKDRLLKEQVETAVNRVLSVKGSMLVEANEGEVTLLGQALAMDLPEVIKAVQKVPGVRAVNNKLEVHDIKEVAPELTRPRQTHRDSEIPTATPALDGFDEDAKFERKV